MSQMCLILLTAVLVFIKDSLFVVQLLRTSRGAVFL